MVFVCLGLLIGCADVPQQEIDNAQAALDAAKNAGADQYLPDQYNAAKSQLDDALAKIEEEKGGLFASYDEAIQMLQSATQAAEAAAAAVPAAKEEVKKEVESLLAQVSEAVETAKKMWRSAPRGKGTREALQMIKDDIEATAARVDEVTQAHEAGNYLEAQKRAQAILDKLKSLQAELQK
jgi:DNA repair exonuclease SbcCD ATPase subunit